MQWSRTRCGATCTGLPSSPALPPIRPCMRTSGWLELMTRYAMARLLHAIPTLLLASLGIFVLLHVIPGDPAVAIAGPDASPETVAAIRTDLGLDQPIPVQYVR